MERLNELYAIEGKSTCASSRIAKRGYDAPSQPLGTSKSNESDSIGVDE